MAAGAALIVALVEPVHPLASVTVTVYVPAKRAVRSSILFVPTKSAQS